jgi:hypothetical protein
VAALGSAAAGFPAEQDGVASPLRAHTRLQSGIVKAKIYTDRTIRYANFCATGNLTEALNSPEWKQAMENGF